MSTIHGPGGAGTPSTRRALRRRIWTCCLLATGLLTCDASFATLGEPADSVVRDRAAMHGAALTRTPMGTFEVDEFTTSDGAEIRQYISPSGLVFAIAWSGRSLPDLRLVLGSHYFRYVAEVGAAASSSKAVSLSTGDLVVQVVKLPRGFAGFANLPALWPPGASVEGMR